MASRYKYSKKAGAVQDAMLKSEAEPPLVQRAELSAPVPRQAMMNQAVFAAADLASEEQVVERSEPASSVSFPASGTRRRRARRVQSQTRANMAAPPPPPPLARGFGGAAGDLHALTPRPSDGRDPRVTTGWSTMFFHTVEDGQRVLVTDRGGRVQVVHGPKRIWSWGRRIRAMAHYVAHPGEFLVVRCRDGTQEHKAGPSDCWFDDRIHLSVEKEDAVQLSAKEAVVVYRESSLEDKVSRRIVQGPATFVPDPGEWLHTFRWHGPSPEAGGFQKVPGALVFQKLWLMPDQMYHDVVDVRTADDAVLTIRLMLFFELVDIERMLVATHDPIGDFINAATSDVVDFVGRRTFDAFKAHTEALNDLSTYKQLTARAEQSGYHVDKVVYRGYGAPPALQRLHDEATESRVRLQLQRATEEQAQELEDFKLDRSLARADKERAQKRTRVDHDLGVAERQQAAQRERQRLDAEQAEQLAAARDARRRAHLEALAALGVDLTALLTRGSADHVLEVRGDVAPHVHLSASDE